MAKNKKAKSTASAPTKATAKGSAGKAKSGPVSKAPQKQEKNDKPTLAPQNAKSKVSKPLQKTTAPPKQKKQDEKVTLVATQQITQPKASKSPKTVTVKLNQFSGNNSLGDNVLKLRKTVVLLSLLTETPEDTIPTTPNTSNTVSPPSSSKYVLSFEQEKALLEVLTFVSSTTKDPHKVAAFCLEQVSSATGHSFCLKLAANHGDSVALKAGLEGLVTCLKLTHTDKTEHSALVLKEIVLINHNRIFCRIRSRHARWIGMYFNRAKKSRSPLLPEVIKTYRQYVSKGPSLASLAVEVDEVEHISKSIEALPKGLPYTTTSTLTGLLIKLLQLINRLWQRPAFRQIFQSCHLSPTLAKLARYVSAASFLVDQFSVHAALKPLKVAVVKLEPWNVPKYVPDPGSFRLFAAKSIPADTDRNLLQRLKHQEQTVLQRMRTEPDAQFADLVSTICPVHAEVQLLFHYELRSVDTPPRIILSTKKPCFLCSLFFQLHGGYYVPKSHGRLYDKWTLPQAMAKLADKRMVSMQGVITRFLDVLAGAMRKTVLSPQRTARLSLESLFLQSAIWARFRSGRSSLRPSHTATRESSKTCESRNAIESLSADSSQETIEPLRMSNSLAASQKAVSRDLSPSSVAVATSADDTASRTTELGDLLVQSQIPNSSRMRTGVAPLNLSTSMIATSPSRTYQSHYVRKGLSIVLDLKRTARARTAPPVRTKSLNISFSLPDPIKQAQEREVKEIDHGYIVVRNEAQTDSDVASNDVPVFDVSTLKPGEDIVVDQTRPNGQNVGFLIKAQDEIISIRCREVLG